MAKALLFLLLTTSCTFAASRPEQAVRDLLNSQVAAWNRGDLDGFMAGYWNSPQLVFQSGATQTRGFQPTLDRYRQRYQQGGHAMGQLAFKNLEVVPLGRKAAFARGEFVLHMPDGSLQQGLFTLVLRKFSQGWRIIHDHTCVAGK